MHKNKGHYAVPLEAMPISRLTQALTISLLAWIALFAVLLWASIRLTDPGPPPHWRHEFDTPAIVNSGIDCFNKPSEPRTCSEYTTAQCVLDDTSIVLPGGTFCTGEGVDLQ